MKRVSALLLGLIMMLTMMPVVSAEPATASTVTPPAIPTTGDVWDGSVEQPTKLVQKDGVYYYEITKCSQLAYVAQTGGDWLGYNYILANDLILNDVVLTWDNNGNCTNQEQLNSWISINGFSGTFLGNHHIISGLYGSGLFGSLNGDVDGIDIVNSYVNGWGGLASSATTTGKSQTNCSFSGAVKGTDSVGGLIGSVHCQSISGLVNYADVYGTSHVAGIVGQFDAYGIENCTNYGNIYATGNYVGGICDYSDIYSISKCQNYGSVTGNNYVGGIIGKQSDSWVGSSSNSGQITGNQYVGGIAGFSQYGSGVTSWVSTISNSYNTGKVTGNSNVGGISGGTEYSNISRCYSIGKLSFETLGGGIVGETDAIWGRSKIENCYYLQNGTVASGYGNVDSDTTDAAEGKSTADMKNQETFKNWSFSETWVISPSLNSGYPYLTWQDVSSISLVGLTLSQTTLSLGVGDTSYLSANPQPATATLPTLTWKSSKTSVATVNKSGRVTAVGVGTTTITVSGGGFSATCTVTISARATEEYRLGELTVRDASGTALSSIPRGSFLVTVPITKLTAGGNTMVMLASYTANGQFKGLLYASVEDVPVGATVKITLPVDNSKGDIALLKAFTIASFSNPVPIGAAVSFPAQ